MGVSSFGNSGPGIMFSIVPIFIFIVFVLVIGMIIVQAIKGGKQWKQNNASPVLTVDATVVSKRTDVSHYRRNSNENHMSTSRSSTTYYVTFQVESGDRMEFHVQDTEYGMLVEGDMGNLTFQGTRYKGFERQK